MIDGRIVKTGGPELAATRSSAKATTPCARSAAHLPNLLTPQERSTALSAFAQTRSGREKPGRYWKIDLETLALGATDATTAPPAACDREQRHRARSPSTWKRRHATMARCSHVRSAWRSNRSTSSRTWRWRTPASARSSTCRPTARSTSRSSCAIAPPHDASDLPLHGRARRTRRARYGRRASRTRQPTRSSAA